MKTKRICCTKDNVPDNAIWIGEGSKYDNISPFTNPFTKKREPLPGITFRQMFALSVALDDDLMSKIRKEFKNKNIAHDCPLDKCCHGDILLEFLEYE